MATYDTDYIIEMIEHAKAHPATVKPNVTAIDLVSGIDVNAPVKPAKTLSKTAKFFKWLYAGTKGAVYTGQMLDGKAITPKVTDAKSLVKTNFNGQKNVYFKPNTFNLGKYNPNGTSDADDCYQVTSLYADFDLAKAGVTVSEGYRKVMKTLDKLGFPYPNATWFTGHGLDMLWALEPGSGAWLRSYWKSVESKLVEVLPYADPAVKSIANFVRVPATINVKPNKPEVTGYWIDCNLTQKYRLSDMGAILNVKTSSEKKADQKRQLVEDAIKFYAEHPEAKKSRGSKVDSSKRKADGIHIDYDPADTPAKKSYKRYILNDIKTYIQLRNASGENIQRYNLLAQIKAFGGDVNYFNNLMADPLTGRRWDYLIDYPFDGHTMPVVDTLLPIMEMNASELRKMRIIKPKELAELNAELKAIRRKLKPALNKLTKQLQQQYVKNSRGTNASIAKSLGVSVDTVKRLKKGGNGMDNDKLVQLMNLCAQLILKDIKAGGVVDTQKVQDLIDTLEEIQDASRHNQRGLVKTLDQLNEIKQMIA